MMPAPNTWQKTSGFVLHELTVKLTKVAQQGPAA